ncbi:Neutral sphingomyelinase isoform X1 [Oopsacas minuta]|uniref:sphingomyelin phosphodiesterase n=1 Tax=Oopsacas minuta TaxID=111878 RepID=A0AAV7JR80_9METZ|nr:Neutral sphingomyelinase isoform X1 [Oopsacas minuta]
MEGKNCLKFATLNTWLLPGLMHGSSKVIQRTNFITEAISTCDHDVLALQEVWIPGLFKQTILNPENFSKNFGYFHYFRSGVVGSGLVTYSKYPIVGVDFFRFSLCGSPFRVDHGDWYGGKGVGVCYIESSVGMLSVYNTHLVADYFLSFYVEHRIIQVIELVKFIQRTKKGHVILLGDLNFTPDSIEYEIITKFGGLNDIWKDEKNAFTFNVANNPFRIVKSPPLRIDYVMIPNGNNCEAIEKKFVFQETNDKTVWYSDHSGLGVQLQLGTPDVQNSRFLSNSGSDALIAAKNILQKSVKKRSKIANFPTAHFMFLTLCVLAVIFLSSIAIFVLLSIFFDTSSVLTKFLFYLTALLIKILICLFMTMFAIQGVDEICRIRHEIVYIDFLLQTQQKMK